MPRKKKSKKLTKEQIIYSIAVLILLAILAYFSEEIENKINEIQNNYFAATNYSNLEEVPKYNGEIYVLINDNKPYFKEEEITKEAFEKYSELDYLGRCGTAFANICKETMPPDGDERGDISSVRPSGWKQTKFDGEYLYNRCHLIAYCLSDEDANELNLITGTRYFNVEGMLTFEKKVLDYINKNKENHVLYRVTPIYEGSNLVANGVEMEAYSVEDNGEGICFNVFVYNVQPGAEIDYATGELLN